jgi:uncharacterized phage infection (PIP) family protein YhgE
MSESSKGGGGGGVFQAGSAVATLGLDTSGFVKGILQANTVMQMFPGWVSAFMANPILGFTKILQDFTRSIVAWVGGVQSMGQQANALAKSVGVNVEQFSLLGTVLGSGTAGLQAAADVYKFLGKAADDASRGNETALGAFARVGVSASQITANLSNLPALLEMVSDGLKALPEGAQRTGVSLDLLGRGGSEYVGKLSQGAQALRDAMASNRERGLGVSAEEAKNAGLWAGAMKELSQTWEGFKEMVAAPIRDALRPYLESITQWVRDNHQWIKAKAFEISGFVVHAIEAMRPAFSWLLDNLQTAIQLLGTLAGAWAGMKTGGFLGSFFGPVGTVVGGVGGVGGGLLGASGGLYATKRLTEGIQVTNNFQMNFDGSKEMHRAVLEVEDRLNHGMRMVNSEFARRAVLGGL